MKLVRAEYNYDGSRLVFFFTSEKRVDFVSGPRLAKTFRTRIELRQIGVRDEAKLLGGVGCCGRPQCCSSWLNDFHPVSIRMAKQQDLPLSPMEISGVCGRLLCCLSYENDFYCEAKKNLPQKGDPVVTEHGPGKVIDVNVLKIRSRSALENEAIVEVLAKTWKEKIVKEEEPNAEAPAGLAAGARKKSGGAPKPPNARFSKRSRSLSTVLGGTSTLPGATASSRSERGNPWPRSGPGYSGCAKLSSSLIWPGV